MTMLGDRALICASAGLRAAAVSLSGVILALSLAERGLEVAAIGLAVSLGLAGCALGTFLVIALADRFGRRASLVLLAGLMALGGAACIVVRHPLVLLVSLMAGMVNGMGRDRGAGVTVEQAMLPQITTDHRRTAVFAWYNVVVDAGHAAGALLGGLPAVLRAHAGCSIPTSYGWTWGLYSVLCLMAGALALRLSPAVEAGVRQPPQRLSAPARPIVAKFAILSGLDSLGGGFLTTALLGYWFFRRFGVDEALLGPLFCIVRVLNGLSHLGAAWLAHRIGLVKTMVWTHLPSSVLLMTVPFAPTLGVAVALFLVREALVEMDVPTRQSYLMAVVAQEEHLRAAGLTNLTRNVAWAVAPAVAGSLMQSVSLSAPLLIGPGLKVAYDVLLYRAFHHVKPPEEQSPCAVSG